MKVWAVAGGCLLLWSTETALPQDGDRTIEDRVDLFVCVERGGERFLEVRRTVTFRGYPDNPVRRLVELRLPWGAMSGSAATPP